MKSASHLKEMMINSNDRRINFNLYLSINPGQSAQQRKTCRDRGRVKRFERNNGEGGREKMIENYQICALWLDLILKTNNQMKICCKGGTRQMSQAN